MTANDLTKILLEQVPQWYRGSRLFRRNVGAGVPYRIALRAVETGDVSLLRPVHFGMAGEPDLCGWLAWRGLAIRLGIEIKRNDEQSPEQIVWMNALRKAGGIYIVARDVEQCRKDLDEAIAKLVDPSHQTTLLCKGG